MTSELVVTDLTRTSHSEIELFTKCERAHYYSYGKKIQKKGPASDALVRGSVGHAALATYYSCLQGGFEYKERIAAATQTIYTQVKEFVTWDIMKIASELMMLLPAYFEFYRDRDEALEVLEVEKSYDIPIGDNFYIKIIIDLLVREANVGVAVWDHKFVYDFFNASGYSLNPQLPKYLGALQYAGWNVAAAYYNEIRYRVTKANADNPDFKFNRQRVPISPSRVANTMREQILAGKRIKHLRSQGVDGWSDRVLRAANSMICKTCPFDEICAAELDGLDTTLIETYNYVPKESRDRNG